jgi:XRE family aerobic/anaerobic benzoate catabolism transcriptional regulator
VTALGDRPEAHAAFRAAVGRRVRFARSLRGLTQHQLAGQAGVSRAFVSSIERGTHGLDAWQLRLVAHAVGRPLGWLLGDEESAR